MTILRTGHRYILDYFEDKTKTGQVLQFIEKEQIDGAFVTVNDGTTNEEVLRVLIDRLHHLNSKLPNHDTLAAITHLEDALGLLEKRTRERQARGVEGTPKP